MILSAFPPPRPHRRSDFFFFSRSEAENSLKRFFLFFFFPRGENFIFSSPEISIPRPVFKGRGFLSPSRFFRKFSPLFPVLEKAENSRASLPIREHFFSGNTCICLLIIFGIKDILVFNNTHANYLKKNQEGTSCNMKELFTDHRVRHAV